MSVYTIVLIHGACAMTVTKVGGANMIAHAQWPQCPPFPRVAVFYVTPVQIKFMQNQNFFPHGGQQILVKITQ